MLYQIFLGLISGIVLVTTIHFLLSKNFSKLQKIILGILFFVPPAQWILGFIFWGQKEVRKNYPITNNDKNRKIISELEHLKAIGLLSKEEYEEKLKNINSQIKEIDIKKSEEYKSLVNLRENGILSDSEFNNKLNDLKQIHKQKNNPQKQGQESYSDEVLIVDLKKRVIEYVEQNFKDSLFLKGLIVTLSMRNNCENILVKYRLKYNKGLCDEIKSFNTDIKKINHILEPLIQKGITQKVKKTFI